MDSARIAALLAPFLAGARNPSPVALSAVQLQQISTYLDLLLRWNARMNLTAVREPEYIVSRHFGESLFAAAHLFPVRHLPIVNCTLLDVGSGAGFPGLPIKIWDPQIALTLVESRQRKATFLREVVRALSLTGVEVFCGRAENFSGRADVVTLRAVERFDDVLPTAAGLVMGAPPFAERSAAKGGNSEPRLALLIGASQLQRARELTAGFSWSEPLPVPQSTSRVLFIGTIRPAV